MGVDLIGQGSAQVVGDAGVGRKDVVQKTIISGRSIFQSGEFGGVGFVIRCFPSQLGAKVDGTCHQVVDKGTAMGPVAQKFRGQKNIVIDEVGTVVDFDEKVMGFIIAVQKIPRISRLCQPGGGDRLQRLGNRAVVRVIAPDGNVKFPGRGDGGNDGQHGSKGAVFQDGLDSHLLWRD